MKHLAYRTWGVRGNPVLVLLHGFLGNAQDWQQLANHLEGSFYLVAVDLPGHGHSRGIQFSKETAFTEFSELLDETLKQLDLKHHSLLGYSLGGRLAISHSASHQDRLEKLLLESAHPGLENDGDKADRLKSDQSWSEKFRTQPLSETLESWYHQPVFADLDHRSREQLMQDRYVANQGAVNEEGAVLADVLEACSLGKQPSYWDSLANLGSPVHYLFGDRDLKFSSLVERYRVPGNPVSLHCIRESGHNIHREQSEAMAREIKRIFRSELAGQGVAAL